MKVLIITGGNIDDDFAFSFLENSKYDEVIAVDGGLAFADRAGMAITHLVGDFDWYQGTFFTAVSCAIKFISCIIALNISC